MFISYLISLNSGHVRMEAHLEDDEAKKVDAVVESWRDDHGTNRGAGKSQNPL